ncbi:MAG: glycosyltransferase [Agathobacter sp.]
MIKKHVTLIIPIYNQEQHIYNCIMNLRKQTFGFCNMEIILVNDGSEDGSGAICEELAKKYDNILYLCQENQGVSAARNRGVCRATGKYIFFLDADDMLERHTIRNVSKFFDTVYDEVDLVTYPIETIYQNRVLEPHFRYRFLKKNGIYDLRSEPYIGQTTMNIVVKNRFEKNIQFYENQSFSEDQRYCCDVLHRTLKMGFCKDGKYIYYRNHNSASGRLSGACYIFEQCMDFFEKLFQRYEKVPLAFQGLFVNDIYWKQLSNILHPYHYDTVHYKIARQRIQDLLQRCDNDVILNHPHMDFFEKYGLLRWKNVEALKCVVSEDHFSLYNGDNLVISEQSMEIVLTGFRITDHRVEISGFIKSVFLQFYQDEVIVCAVENEGALTRKLPLHLSAHCYYHSHEQTQRFLAFRYEADLLHLKKVRFEVGFGCHWFPTHYYFMPRMPFSHEHKRYLTNYQGYQIQCTSDNSICFEQTDIPAQNRVWLYYDCVGVPIDNGGLQFIHDIEKCDGVLRYYIVTDVRQRDAMNNYGHLVDFGSTEHKSLLQRCEKVLTAYIEESNIFPFDQKQLAVQADCFQFETIYLQHGVLHIKMPWKFSPEKIMANKVVVSTYEEKALLIENGFRETDLIETGQARFECLHQEYLKDKKILMALSWRCYLIGGYHDHKWEPLLQKFMSSNYFREFQEFLSNKNLHKMLEEYEFQLDIKLHPIFTQYQEVFHADSENIHFVDGSICEEEYGLLITDFSSFLYDFIYLDTDIINFIPDIDEFKCGMNGYRELNYPEDFWDEVAYTSDELVQKVQEFLEGVSYKFKYGHFLPIGECREDLYQKLI